MTEDQYVAAIKSAAVTVESNLIKGALATVPFFALPVISTITNTVVDWGVTWLVGQEAMGVFFLYTDFRVSSQGNDFINAALANQQAKTPQEKASAEANLIAKFNLFAKFTT